MLKLVPPPPEMSPADKLRESVKKRFRPDGMLQCNRCGGRTLMTLTHGVFIENGRKKGGTVIEKDVCENCYKRGIVVSMLPALKPIK